MSEEITYETGFMVIGTKDGEFFISTDFNETYNISRPPTRRDVKRSCKELYDKLMIEDMAQYLNNRATPTDS